MRITEFLLARIAEDEAHARYVYQYGSSSPLALFAPPRVLAECAAKRTIVESKTALDSLDLKGDPVRCGMYSALSDVIEDLAAVYASHPDYRQEWAC